RCVEAEDVGFITVWGVSANKRSWWDNSGAERLGYRPTQDAEVYAEEILARPNPLDALGQRYQGGSFVGIDYSRDDIAGRPF
ncbi:MAG TPA: NAD(P)-dependent oxidoreductase, partial [Paraburkholderia sp.]|nr:NAD(P)-dependent oxidoreductase [Paraburkholderia sp.]